MCDDEHTTRHRNSILFWLCSHIFHLLCAREKKGKEMSIKRHLSALFHRERCDRQVLIPMLDKLNEQEQQALWRLLQEKEQQVNQAKRHSRRGF